MTICMKAASAAVIALVIALPVGGAMAAGQSGASATMTKAPVSSMAKPAMVNDPSGIVGHWTLADISGIDGAKSVKILDLRKTYGSKAREQIAAVEKSDKAALAKLHTALNGDAKFKAWARKNHVNIDRVVGVSNGEVAVF